MDTQRSGEDIQVYRKKRAHARAITRALVEKNSEALQAELMRIIFDRFDVKEICSTEMSDGKSPLRHAVTEANGKTRMLQELKEKARISFDVRFEPDQMTILHLAVRAQDKAVLKYLIKQGVKINGIDKNGETALHCAIRSNSVSICSALLDAKISIEKKDNQRRTALHVAVEPLISSAKEKIELLCKKGASPNAIDSDGNTPLHLLMRRRPEDLLEKLAILIKFKVEPSMKNNDGKTALKLYRDHEDNDPEELQQVLDKLPQVPHMRSKSLAVLPAIVFSLHTEEPVNVPAPVTRRASEFSSKRRLSGFLRRFSHSHKSKYRSSRAQSVQIDENIADESETDGLHYEPLTAEQKRKMCEQFVRMQNEWHSESESETDCSASDRSDSPCDKRGYLTTDDDCDSEFSRGNLSRNNSIASFRSRSSSRRKDSFDFPKLNESFHRRISLAGLPGSPRHITTATSLHSDLNRTELMHDKRKARVSSLPLSGESVVDETQLLSIWRGRARNSSLAHSVPNSDGSEASQLGASDADISSCSSQSRKNSQETNHVDDLPNEYKKDNEKAHNEEHAIEKSTVIGGLHPYTAGGQGCIDRNGSSEKVSSVTLIAVGVAKESTATLTFPEIEEAEDPLFAQLNSMNQEECLAFLKDYKEKDVNEIIDCCNGESLLHLVVRHHFPLVFYHLMTNCIMLDSRDNMGWTSVHIAAESGNLAMLKMLINSGADKEAVTDDGDTALGIAISHDRTNVVEYLLKDMSISASYLELSLYRLVRERRRKEVTNLFVRRIAAAIKEGDYEIHMVLPLAAKLQHWGVVSFLIDQLDKRDTDGYCAAHYACMYDNASMLSKLHDAGASLKRKRKTSFDEATAVTVSSIAKDNGFDEILDLLKKINNAQRKKSSNLLLVPGS